MSYTPPKKGSSLHRLWTVQLLSQDMLPSIESHISLQILQCISKIKAWSTGNACTHSFGLPLNNIPLCLQCHHIFTLSSSFMNLRIIWHLRLKRICPGLRWYFFIFVVPDDSANGSDNPKAEAKEDGPLIALNPRKKQAFKLIEKENLSHNVRRFRFALQSPQHRFGLPCGKHVYIYGK